MTLKEQYEAEFDKLICYVFQDSKWRKDPFMNTIRDCNYIVKYIMILKKHIVIADAVCANPKVEVKGTMYAPDDFLCIWEKEVSSSLRANSQVNGDKKSVERLYTLQENKEFIDEA